LVVASSDTNVVVVRANNMLETRRPGTVTLSAIYLGQTNSATVAVRNIGELKHRYSFNADATDSVGAANGVLQGNATVSGGRLILDGSGGTYLDLPAAVLDGYNAVTVDAWVTFNTSPAWTRLWYFGDDRANEFYFSPAFNGGTTHSFQAPGVGQTVSGPLRNQTLHLTFVYGNGVMQMYTNGVVESSTSSIMARFSQIGTSFAWIGRSPYVADAYLDCSVDEFRIYRGRLAPDEILALHALGPNQLPTTEATLAATLVSGNVVLNWPVAAAGFAVQAKSDLTGNWNTLTNAPALAGSNWQVTVPASGAQFFRLWK
jgi:hypothetical protein